MPHDDKDKIDYKDFVKAHDNVVKGKNNVRGGQGISTRRMLNTFEERIGAIVEVLPKRPTVNLGALLSSCDADGNQFLTRPQFYNVIDGLQSNLGEGDILEMMKHYDPDNRN